MLYAYSNFNNALSQWTNRKKKCFRKLDVRKLVFRAWSHSIIEKKPFIDFRNVTIRTPACGHAMQISHHIPHPVAMTQNPTYFLIKKHKKRVSNIQIWFHSHNICFQSTTREKKKFKSNTTHLSAFVQLEWNPPTAKSTYPSSVCFPVISPTREQKRKRKKYIWTNHNHW